ncbi:MAG: hypothetical protein P8186_04805 [Anaerolineae bacterium]|jgi:hypothetical protein
MATEQLNLQVVRYGFPNSEHPCYHLKLHLDPVTPDELTVRQVRADGKHVRDFWVYNDGRFDRKDAFYSDQDGTLVLRLDWTDGSSHRVEVDLEDSNGKALTLSSESRAPDWGGYWNPGWQYYGATVLQEHHGLAREGEPVHLLLGVYADRLTDPQREVRVVGIDPVSGKPEQVPCQVYGVSSWDKRQDEHCQPTVTLEVAFLADVPASTGKVYLIFYGNPEASQPAYPTDLAITGEGLGLTVDNNHYQVRLHPKSGAIDEVLLKQGVNVVFDHHLETNGALHWNPGVYAPPRIWIHASDWDPPAGYATLSGPVFLMTKRWGPLPDYPEVECSISYTFYANQPYVMMTSTLDVIKDLDAQALRNGEIVLNHNVVREFAWKQMNGDVDTVVIKERPRHPTRGLDLDARTPWWAFFNRDVPCALAAMNLELSAMRRNEALARWEPYFYMHWGPWAYCARPLVYTFATPNPQRLIRVPESSSYYERMAIYPCRLGLTDKDRFVPVEQVYQRLAKPLSTSVTAFDVDARVPEEWVPPILVSEFEEMEDE